MWTLSRLLVRRPPHIGAVTGLPCERGLGAGTDATRPARVPACRGESCAHACADPQRHRRVALAHRAGRLRRRAPACPTGLGRSRVAAPRATDSGVLRGRGVVDRPPRSRESDRTSPGLDRRGRLARAGTGRAHPVRVLLHLSSGRPRSRLDRSVAAGPGGAARAAARVPRRTGSRLGVAGSPGGVRLRDGAAGRRALGRGESRRSGHRRADERATCRDPAVRAPAGGDLLDRRDRVAASAVPVGR